MIKVIDILKYAIFYKKYRQPILTVFDKEQELFIKLTEQFFTQRDIISVDKINSITFNNYRSIILNDIKIIPNNLSNLLTEDGIIYFFSSNPVWGQKKLSTMFRYVKTDKITPDFKLLKDKKLSKIVKFELKNINIYLIRASFLEIEEIDYNVEISFEIIDNLLKEILESFTNSNDNRLSDRVLSKQNFLKKTITELFYQNRDLKDEIIINKNKMIFELNNREIDYIKKMIFLNKESIDNELRFLKELPFEKKAIQRPFIVSDNEKALKEKAKELKEVIRKNQDILEKHNLLIDENNNNISIISHLEFDLEELLREKESLESVISELESIIESSDLENQAVLEDTQLENEKNIQNVTEKFEKKISEYVEAMSLLEDKIEFLSMKSSRLTELEEINYKNKKNIELLVKEIKRLRKKCNKMEKN